MNRPLVALLSAKAISDVGFALDFVCLAVFVWVRTESPAATAALGVCTFLGGIVGGRLGHRYGADWDRRRAMVGADLVRMVALLGLAVVPTSAQLWWLFPTMLLVGGGRTVFEATLAAATPVLAGERTQTVNSVLAALKGGALVAGMALATVAVPLVGFRGVFALDGASYALSAIAVLALPLRLREPVDRTEPAGPQRFGWAALLASGVAVLVAVRGLDGLGSASHHVGLPILGDQRDPANPAGVVGTIWMCWAAGMLISAVLLRPLLRRQIAHSPRTVFYLATAVMSAGFIGIFWLDSWLAIVTAAIIAGFGDSFSEVTYKQSLQRLPDRQRGPAFGLSGTVVNSGFLVGLALTGLFVEPGWAAEWVLVMHGVPLLVAVGAVGWSAYRRNRGTPANTAPHSVGVPEEL